MDSALAKSLAPEEILRGDYVALLHVVAELGSAGLPLRIRAPVAAQGTALEEHERADAGTVVEGEALDVEDPTLVRTLPDSTCRRFAAQKPCSVRWMISSCSCGVRSTK